MMRWNFGGNLQPVRMICEYDWKECPIALISYVWSEIVADVVESINGEWNLWRILALVLFFSMIFHTMYHKIRLLNNNNSENEVTRNHLIKIGLKMRDLELKINILTYKMQYGTWPLPHEIPTSSLNDLRKVKLTLSNTSRHDMWTKHHLHGYISKCLKNSDDNKSMDKFLSMNEEMNLDNEHFLSELRNGDSKFHSLNSKGNLELLDNENTNCKDYERLIKTTKECRRYMNEINESNKSLGLFENSSDISDRNSLKDVSGGTESEENSRRYLIDPKRWHEIYKYNENNKKDEDRMINEMDFTTSNQILSISNLNNKDSPFSTDDNDDERYPLRKSSKNRSKLLPPGLSITFLSDKFQTCKESRDKCLTVDEETSMLDNKSKNKTSTNETLNKVREKLESLHDIKQFINNSKSLSNVGEILEDPNKNSSEIPLAIEKSSEMKLIERNGKFEKKNEQQSNVKEVKKFISNECDTSSGDNGAPIVNVKQKLPARHLNFINEYKSMPKMTNRSFSNIEKAQSLMNSNVRGEIALDRNLDNVKIDVEDPRIASKDINNRKSITFGTKKSAIDNSGIKSSPKIVQKEEILSPESDSSTSFEINLISKRNKDVNCTENLCEKNKNLLDNEEEDIFNLHLNRKKIENNINLNSENNEMESTSMRYVFSPENKSVRRIEMETDEEEEEEEDGILNISQKSSQTELSKDSETDERSTTTLLREALDFKKALLMQMNRENEICDEKRITINEISDCESDDTSQSKTDNNHFRSKLLDIISEEQSAGSSTEKTSRTYILSKSINETNLRSENPDNNYLNRNNNAEDLKSNLVITIEGDSCGNSKSIITASCCSSEYFSLNNITDNEHNSGLKMNYSIADGDGIRELQKSTDKKEKEVEFNVLRNRENDNITQGFYTEIKNRDEEKERKEKSQDIRNKETETIIDVNSIQREEEMNEINECMIESRENPSYETEAEIKLTRKGGRNFAKAEGEDLNSENKKQRSSNSIVSLFDTNVSDHHSEDVIEEVLEMIEDSGIFELEKSESKCKKKPKTKEEEDHPSEGMNLFNNSSNNNVLQLHKEKFQGKQDIFSKLKTLDAFTKPLDITECNLEKKNENDCDAATPLTGRTVVCNSNTNTTNITESFIERENDLKRIEKSSGFIKDFPDSLIPQNINIGVEKFQSNGLKTMREDPTVHKYEIAESNTILNVSNSENKLSEIKSENLTVKPVSDLEKKGEELASSETNFADKNFDTLKRDVNLLQSKKMIANVKKIQLSKSSITNFSTDTSESYFDTSNHDFAVSSIILTSQNSNFLSNYKEDYVKSDTSSSYVDASDYCSKIAINSSSNEGDVTASELNVKTEEIKSSETGISSLQNLTTENDNDVDIKRDQSLTKTELIPKYSLSLPSNNKKSESNTKQNSSSSLNQEKIDHKRRSCIPILKSRIEIDKREKSIEGKTRSQSPVSRLNTPRIQSADSNLQIKRNECDNKKLIKGSSTTINNGSKKTLNKKQSYVLPNNNNNNKTNDTERQESSLLNSKSESLETREYKIRRLISNELSATSLEKTNFLDPSEQQLTKECTVIYINIISDSDGNEFQNIDAKELMKYVNDKDLMKPNKDQKLDSDSKCQSLSLRNLKYDSSNEINNFSEPSSDGKLCKDLSEDLKNGNEDAGGFLKLIEKDSERLSEDLESGKIRTTANDKLLSTSTLEILNSPKIEQKEKEVLAKPSVKNISTSVSDFPDVSPPSSSSEEEKRLFYYNPKKEVFDTLSSKDFIQKEKILLSETLTSTTTTNDQNFFECKKTHKLYNKLGLSFASDQIEQS